LDRTGQEFCRAERVGTGHGVVQNMHCRSRAHRQSVTNADGDVADAHRHKRHCAAVLLGQTQPLFHGAGRSGIKFVRHTLAHHAFGVRVDFDGDGAGGNYFTANDNVQCFALPWNSDLTVADKQRRLENPGAFDKPLADAMLNAAQASHSFTLPSMTTSKISLQSAIDWSTIFGSSLRCGMPAPTAFFIPWMNSLNCWSNASVLGA